MRTFSIVGRAAILDQPARRRCRPRRAARAAVGRRVVRADDADQRRRARRARRGCARRWPRRRGASCSDWNRTTGTGASGEMRVTAPDDEAIEHHVADDEHAAAAEPRHAVARAPASIGGSVMRARRAAARRPANGSVTSMQEHHQELGVAEVVLEQAGGQHADQRGERGGRAALRTVRRSFGRVAREHADEHRARSRAPADPARRQSASARCAGAG